MLAGNADRERTVDVLRAAYAEGRLTKEEYDQRTGRALAARSIEELQHLTADVPQGPGNGSYPVQQLPAAFGGPVQGWPPHNRYPAYPLPPPAKPTNAAAVGALVCGLLTPFTLGFSGLPAVILGHKARAEIRRSGDRGDGSAVAGLALGWLALAVLVLVVIASVV
jgi:hypothetical protein